MPRLENETREEYKRRWQRENKDKVKVARDRYLKKNRKIIAQRTKDWRQNNPEFLKERRPHWHRKTIYGISELQFMQMYQKQNGKCAICSHKPKENQKNLCVDHCHSTGKFRGLLCQSCNRGIGLIGESTEKLTKAIKYLEVAMAGNEYDPYKD